MPSKTVQIIIVVALLVGISGGAQAIVSHNEKATVHNAMMEDAAMKKSDEAKAMKKTEADAAMKQEEATKAAAAIPAPADAMAHDDSASTENQ